MKAKTVLITGSNRGLGLEFARQYAADGWNVIATCRKLEAAVELQKLAAANKAVRIEVLDVVDAKSIAVLRGKLQNTGVDVLINNAGIVSGGLDHNHPDYMDPPEPEFGSLDAAAWLDVLRVNTIAPVMVTEALVPNLALGANAKVIMLSSRYGSIELNLPDSIPYCSAKAALNMVMRKIALSLKPQQITVVSFHPGWVKTDMGGQNADIAPAVSVSGMRTVIAGLSLRETGLFLDYNGKPVPW